MAERTPSDPDPQEMRELVRLWVDDLWVDGKVALIDELLVPDCVVRGLAAEALIGPEGFRPFFEMVYRNYRQIAIHVDHCLVDGDWISAFLSCESLHLDSFNEIAVTGCASFRVVGGRFVEIMQVFDYLAILGQTDALAVDIREALFPIPAPAPISHEGASEAAEIPSRRGFATEDPGGDLPGR